MNKEIKKSIEKLVDELNKTMPVIRVSNSPKDREKNIKMVETALNPNKEVTKENKTSTKKTSWRKVPKKKKPRTPFEEEKEILGMSLNRSVIQKAIMNIHLENEHIHLETITKSVCDYVLKKARKKFGKKFYNKGGGSKKRIAMPKLSVKQFVKIRPQKPDKPTKAKATKAKK